MAGVEPARSRAVIKASCSSASLRAEGGRGWLHQSKLQFELLPVTLGFLNHFEGKLLITQGCRKEHYQPQFIPSNAAGSHLSVSPLCSQAMGWDATTTHQEVAGPQG